jgi:hypothetical protein
MKRILVGAAVAVGAMIGLVGCSSSVVGPVTVELDQLQGETVDVSLDRTLNINVGDSDVESFTVVVEDTKVAKAIAGVDDGSAQFNPGVEPVAVGTTTVTVTDKNGDLDPIDFVLNVAE